MSATPSLSMLINPSPRAVMPPPISIFSFDAIFFHPRLVTCGSLRLFHLRCRSAAASFRAPGGQLRLDVLIPIRHLIKITGVVGEKARRFLRPEHQSRPGLGAEEFVRHVPPVAAKCVLISKPEEGAAVVPGAPAG